MPHLPTQPTRLAPMGGPPPESRAAPAPRSRAASRASGGSLIDRLSVHRHAPDPDEVERALFDEEQDDV